MCVLVVLPGLAAADVPPSTPNEALRMRSSRTSMAREDARGEASPADRRPAQREARRAAGAAVYLLAGILAVGILLIALVMIWGHRLRRIIRTAPARSTSLDEFWYLRQNRLKQRHQQRETTAASDPDGDVTEAS